MTEGDKDSPKRQTRWGFAVGGGSRNHPESVTGDVSEFDPIADRCAEIAASGLFDVDYYVRNYPDVTGAGIDPIDHYVRYGEREGRSPSADFDPFLFNVIRGRTQDDEESALLTFCQCSPAERDVVSEILGALDAEGRAQLRILIQSGAFDADHYRSTDTHADSRVPPVIDYFVAGFRRGTAPNAAFDPAFYRGHYPDVLEDGVEPFFHYLAHGRSEGRAGSRSDPAYAPRFDIDAVEAARSGGLFDIDFYRATVATLPQGVDPFEHYLSIGWHEHLRPSADFDPVFYFAANPAVRASGVPPLVHYYMTDPDKRPAVVPDGRYHWAGSSCHGGDDDIHIERLRAASFFFRYDIGAGDSQALKHRLSAVADIAGRRPAAVVDDRGLQPLVSIIVPVYGELPFVLNCLDSIACHETRHRFEVLVIDDASPVAARVDCLADIPWIRFIRSAQNRGFLGTCNSAVDLARGEYIVLLNSDTRVCDGWLDELIDTFAFQPRAGLIGSKLYFGDGTLQEAGGIVWEDGSAWNYGRGDAPWRPEYSYARQVDYCSGAAIAVPKDLWNELGGFDTHFSPAYYEDVDLAFRVRAAGREVWLQPLARVIHYEGVTHGRDETKGVKKSQVVNAKKLFERWKSVLSSHGTNGVKPLEAADRKASRRMLALDAVTPTPNRDAGSVMTVKLLQLYQKLGWHVSFATLHDPRYDMIYSADLQRVGIKVIANPAGNDVAALLGDPGGHYEAVLGFRVTVLGPELETIRATAPAALVLFHDIDLHYLRMQREAELTGSAKLVRDAEIMMDDEFDLMTQVDCTIVPSTVEKDIIQDAIGVNNVVVYSYTADVVSTEAALHERRHIVFVGGFRHSPNVDAMRFFIEDVWPSLSATLPRDAKLYVVGADAPDSLVALADDRIVFTGFAEDLGPVLAECRVFVAPLRYGAGLKGKVVTALSYGVPCVASAIAIEGMDLTPDVDVLEANDAASFIAKVKAVYDDPTLWDTLRRKGQAFVDDHYGWETGMVVARETLSTAEATWLSRRRRDRTSRLAALKAEIGTQRLSTDA